MQAHNKQSIPSLLPPSSHKQVNETVVYVLEFKRSKQANHAIYTFLPPSPPTRTHRSVLLHMSPK